MLDKDYLIIQRVLWIVDGLELRMSIVRIFPECIIFHFHIAKDGEA